MSDMRELIIYQKHYDLVLYAFPVINRFPKSQRFVLGQQIETSLLQFGLLIIQANQLRQKRGKLMEADTELEKLRYLVRLAKDLQFLTLSKYEIISQRLNEIGKLLGGWMKAG
ncbi:MAG: diversity-generating retroelement protein Avd [Dehalococcoidia bacterium]|jgi:four helix bundle protein